MADSGFEQKGFSFEGYNVAYYRGGAGAPLLLLHGSGPGASSLGNWRAVLAPLAERYEVFAMDLLGFGGSDRKSIAPLFDYAQWLRQAQAMLALIPGEKVGVIGHSLSASLALSLSSVNARVASVLTTGAMGAIFEATDATRRTWSCPTNRQELVFALSDLIHDASSIDEAYLATREAVIFAPGYADYFNQMFEGDPARYIEFAKLDADVLANVRCPVAMLHGRDDRAFPASNSIELASQLPRADLCLLSECSHSVAFERKAEFVALAYALFGRTL